MTPPQPAGIAPVPHLLCDIRELVADTDSSAGAVWKLAEPGRQLDANVVHLPANATVGTHTEPDLDVLFLVVAGSGTIDSPDGAQPLAAGNVFWLPHGSTRSLRAGESGLFYLTVHRRRAGMSIRSGSPGDNQDPSPEPTR